VNLQNRQEKENLGTMSLTLQAQAQKNDSPLDRVQALKANIHRRRKVNADLVSHALDHYVAPAETKEFRLAELTPSEGSPLPAGLLLKAKGAVNLGTLQIMAAAQEPKPAQRFEVEHASSHAGPGASPSVPGEAVPTLA